MRGDCLLKIEYKSKKLEKVCTDAKTAEKQYGRQMAEKIQLRIDQITAADSIGMLVQLHIGRCHALTGDRKGQYAMDLVQPYRLVFQEKNGNIEVAQILEIIDYH